MKVNTALGFVFSGLAFSFTFLPDNLMQTRRIPTLSRQVCAGLVLLIGLFTLGEHVSGRNFGIDELLIHGEPDSHTSSPGRMSIMSALNFTFFGIILLLWKSRNRLQLYIKEFAAVATLSIAALALLGYIYNSEALFNLPFFSSMALHTVLMFTLLSMGVLCTHPQFFPQSWRYGLAVLAVAIAFKLRLGLTSWIGPGLPIFVTFYPAIMIVALTGGFRSGLLATALSVSVTAIWIFEPIGVFSIESLAKRVSLVLYLGMGFCISFIIKLYQNNRQKAANYDREQAVRTSRQEVEFLGRILKHASQPFAVGYLDGRIGRMNPAFEELTGYSAAELQQLDWSTVLTPPEWHAIEQEKLAELVRTGQPIRYEKEYLRKDGTRIPIELLVHAETNSQNKLDFFYGFITDISERKKADTALRESEHRFRQVTESLPQLIWTCNSEGICDYLSPQWCKYTGIPEAQQLGIGWLEQLHPEDRDLAISRWKICVSQGTNFSIEYRIHRYDGTYRWFQTLALPVRNETGAIIKWFGSNTDIQDIKHAETLVRESSERLRFALETCQIGAWDMNLDDRTAFRSLEHARIFGYAELQPNWDYNQFLSHVLAEDKVYVNAKIQETINTQGKIDFECRICRIDGMVRWIWVTGRHTVDEESGIRRMAGIIQDITERKEIENEKTRLLTIIQENPDFIGLSDLQGNLLYHNPTALRLVGLPSDTDISTLTINDMHPDWASQRVLNEGIPTALEDGSWHSENALLHRDGHEIPVNQLLMVHKNIAGEPEYLSTIMHDTTESKRLEHRFKQAVELAPNAIVIYNEFGMIQLVNLQTETYFGYSRLELIGQPIEILLPNRLRTEDSNFRQEHFSYSQPRTIDLDYRPIGLRKDGSEFAVEIGIAFIEEENGVLIMSSIIDISERELVNTRLQEALKQKELLLKEVYHRVKNNLQVVASLISMQANQIKNVEALEALQQSANRIKSLALIHERLYRAKDLEMIDFNEYCQSLIDHLMFVFKNNKSKIKVNLTIDKIYLDVDTTIPLGLIINELLSNAFKHAFPINRPGEIGVFFSQDHNEYILVISDNGIGLPPDLDFKKTTSLGLTLVIGLSEQLSGNLSLDKSNGTRFTLSFTVVPSQQRILE